MEVLFDRCCGLDVHREQVTACVLISDRGKLKKEIRQFSTFTERLEELARWLDENGVTHVGMESTGVYWKPVYYVLEEAQRFELIVGNAHHIKNVPGRKTDMKDAEWIAHLVRVGLIRKSYVPPPPLRDLRDLVRYRKSLLHAQTAERNRLHKLLETANIKLGSVASDVFGKSGRKMLAAIVAGQTDPLALAELAEGLLRKKLPDLRLALTGRLRDHHRMLLKMQLDRLDEVERHIAALEAEIAIRLAPYRQQVENLDTIPGVDQNAAAAIIAELGPDMSVFPSVGHAAAWASVAPGCNESAGKRRHAAARKGNMFLLTALCEAAMAARNQKGTYLRDKYYRLKGRRGPKRALVAIAHKILIAAYHILRDGVPYQDLRDTYLDSLDKTRVTRNLVRRLERLGHHVTLAPIHPPEPSPQGIS